MRSAMIACWALCFTAGHSFSMAVRADENAELCESVVMIHAETMPKGIKRYFPAIVLASTSERALLVSASWGADPFPVPPAGRAIDSMHLLGSDEPVEAIDFDVSLGLAIFQVGVPLKPWPEDKFSASKQVVASLSVKSAAGH